MTKKGRKPTPTKIRVLRGNPGKRPLNDQEIEPSPLPDIPEPTERLNKNALKIWQRITQNMQQIGLLTVLDIDALTRYVILLDEWQTAVADVKRDGRTVTRRTQFDEYQVANPRFGQLLQINKSLKEFEASFGFNPSARSTLAIPNQDNGSGDIENFLFAKMKKNATSR